MKYINNLICQAAKIVFTALLFIDLSGQAIAEGSGEWYGLNAPARQSWLWIPVTTSNGTGINGYTTRGYMLLPSGTTGYNAEHRLLVYVKAGETVFFGFRLTDPNYSSPVSVKWYYDPSASSSFFPTCTTPSNCTSVTKRSTAVFFVAYRLDGTTNASGKPGSFSAAANGPSQITGAGYTARSFTNSTGTDKAYWVEMEGINGASIDYWDISVASGSAGNYIEKKGRVYSKYWSINNSRETATSGNLEITVAGSADQYSYPDNFGFYVPIDNTYSAPTNDYFIKRMRLSGASGGWVNYYANNHGPQNTGDYEIDRRSILGSGSKQVQYPLFINDPDPLIWTTTPAPNASLEIDYREKIPPKTGGEAIVNISISLPAIVDVLIDLDGDRIFTNGVDILLSENFTNPGSKEIYWNGEDASGNELQSGTNIEFIVAVIFFPVHFPIFDLEQSLGIRIENIRPTDSNQNNEIFWDNSLFPPLESLKSSIINVTGKQGPEHIWWSPGGNIGFGDDRTINTWAASYYSEIKDKLGFSFLTVAGNVFEDANGLGNGKVDGYPVSFSGLHAVLIKSDGTVGRIAPVQADGSFLMRKVANGDFKIIITLTPPALGEPDPGPSLPANWIHTGEFLGAGLGSDSDADGYLDEFTIKNSSIVNANFGLIDLRILPVSWIFFRGKAVNEQVHLEWATAQEQNNDYFILERSPDGKDWKALAKTTSTGDSQTVSAYLGLDLTPTYGNNYYRLVLVDVMGKTSHSQVIRVEYDPEWEINVFPNPFMEEVSIRAKDLQDFKIRLTDMQGRNIPLRQKAGDFDQLIIETNELTSGVYILTLQNNLKSINRKLTKQ